MCRPSKLETGYAVSKAIDKTQAQHIAAEPAAESHLAPGVGEDDRLCDGQSLIQVTQSVQLPVLLLHIDIELLDTLKGQLITLDKNAHLHMVARCNKVAWASGGRDGQE